MSNPNQPQRDPSTSARGKKKKRSKPLQNKKGKLKVYKGEVIPKGKKPNKH